MLLAEKYFCNPFLMAKTCALNKNQDLICAKEVCDLQICIAPGNLFKILFFFYSEMITY